MQNSARVLVTGGTGFIGGHLVERLLSQECDITIVDSNRQSSTRKTIDRRVVIKTGSIDALITTGELQVGDFDYVFHLAGNSNVQTSIEQPILDFDRSLRSTIYLLDAMRKVENPPMLIFPSSAAVYGNPVTLPICESSATVPISPYGVSKLAAEKYIEVFSKIYSLRSVCLRAFSVYGPNQRKQVIFDLINKLSIDPDKIDVIGDGTQHRDFIYINDFVDLMLLCTKQKIAAGDCLTINAASGTSTAIRELVLQIAQALNVSPKVSFTGVSRPGEPIKWVVDISAARKLGFTPSIALEEGLRRVIHWYKSQIIDHSQNSCSQKNL
ncbi:MAG TPA: NAD-dependent epimerase/dehydratase family protein [Oculatellaceae cyanobacterium]